MKAASYSWRNTRSGSEARAAVISSAGMNGLVEVGKLPGGPVRLTRDPALVELPEVVPAFRGSEEPGVALEIGERRPDGVLPLHPELRGHAGLIEDHPGVAAAAARILAIERPEVDEAAAAELQAPLVRVPAIGEGVEPAQQVLHRVEKVLVRRREPTDRLVLQDGRGGDELLGVEGLAEPAAAGGDVEAAGLGFEALLAIVRRRPEVVLEEAAPALAAVQLTPSCLRIELAGAATHRRPPR